MAKAKLFTTDKGQTVRIPKALAFPSCVSEVEVIAVGEGRLIVPADQSWNSWFFGEDASSDFMETRDQHEE